MSGGLGSGKSLALCLKLAMRAREPGAHELLIRKTNATLNRSTLRTLLEGDGSTPAVLPPGTYLHHKLNQEIRLHAGGAISYFGVDEPQKIGSINATGAACDEASELTEADMTMIRGRVRSKHTTLANQLYLATNPKGPRHHLAVRFGLDGTSRPAPGTEAITASTADNANLPGEYIADLGRLSGADRQRLFEGKWVQATGLVYSQFDRRMIQPRTGPWQTVVVGQDCGYSDPDVLLVACRDEAGRVHVADEWCLAGQLIDKVVEQAHKFREQYGVTAFHVDPSAARLRETMVAAGLNAQRAENPILDGIRMVQRHMVFDGDGVPSFTVDPCCVNLVRELESYAWHPDKSDMPVDKFNHCCDALRYAVMSIDRPACWCGVVQITDGDDDGDWKPLRAGAAVEHFADDQ